MINKFFVFYLFIVSFPWRRRVNCRNFCLTFLSSHYFKAQLAVSCEILIRKIILSTLLINCNTISHYISIFSLNYEIFRRVIYQFLDVWYIRYISFPRIIFFLIDVCSYLIFSLVLKCYTFSHSCSYNVFIFISSYFSYLCYFFIDVIFFIFLKNCRCI